MQLNVSQWTTAPLQINLTQLIPKKPDSVFELLSDPSQLCHIFSWMEKIEVEKVHAKQEIGLGSKRWCHFGNGLVLEETIVGWWPPHTYAYRGNDVTHPFGMRGHLGVIHCERFQNQTRLVWQHWFDHSNPAAMKKRLLESIDAAIVNLKNF